MSVIGIGTDIVHVPRIGQIIKRNEQGFIGRVLHTQEQLKYAHASQRSAFLAKRFAVKEAVAKALGTGIGQHACFTDIETWHNSLGKPNVTLHGDAKNTADALGVEQVLVSIADEKDYAIAFVTLMGGPAR